MATRKNALPFDKRGGSIVLQRRLLESTAFGQLSVWARCLLPLLHCQWRNDRAVHFGVREAANKLACNPRTAMAAFDELQKAGFIRQVDGHLFDTFGVKGGSRPRSWRLTWLPFRDKPPTNEWEKQNADALATTEK